jgi:hypothetical protein
MPWQSGLSIIGRGFYPAGEIVFGFPENRTISQPILRSGGLLIRLLFNWDDVVTFNLDRQRTVNRLD